MSAAGGVPGRRHRRGFGPPRMPWRSAKKNRPCKRRSGGRTSTFTVHSRGEGLDFLPQEGVKSLTRTGKPCLTCNVAEYVDGLTDTPGSVFPHCYRHGNSGHPSTDAVADALQRPTRALGRAALNRALYGLAPGGVYLAFPVTREAGGLLHHRFTLTCASGCANTTKLQAVCFLWHWPAGYPEWALPTTLLCGARTFLEPLS